MTLAPLLDASAVTQVHVAAAILALLSGPVAFLRRSRDRWHRGAGRVWVGAMAVAALSSFLIHEGRMLGPFSPIHLLSVITLVGLWQGVAHARAGRRADHARQMRLLLVLALILPGLFTLLPGRRMSDALFPAAPETGFAIVAALAVALVAAVLRDRRARPANSGAEALAKRDGQG